MLLLMKTHNFITDKRAFKLPREFLFSFFFFFSPWINSQLFSLCFHLLSLSRCFSWTHSRDFEHREVSGSSGSLLDVSFLAVVGVVWASVGVRHLFGTIAPVPARICSEFLLLNISSSLVPLMPRFFELAVRVRFGFGDEVRRVVINRVDFFGSKPNYSPRSLTSGYWWICSMYSLCCVHVHPMLYRYEMPSLYPSDSDISSVRATVVHQIGKLFPVRHGPRVFRSRRWT